MINEIFNVDTGDLSDFSEDYLQYANVVLKRDIGKFKKDEIIQAIEFNWFDGTLIIYDDYASYTFKMSLLIDEDSVQIEEI